MKNPRTMTAGEVNRALDRLDLARRKLTDRFIEAGRGNERWSEIQNQRDSLSVACILIESQRDELEAQIYIECGPGMSRFPRGWRRSNRVTEP